MNALLTEGGKRFWDDLEKEEQGLDDCTAASHLAAASGELIDMTARTRTAVTGRANNGHLFYRSAVEAKRRMEIARNGRPRLTVDDLVARRSEDAAARKLRAKLASADEAGTLADVTRETRIAITGRSYPDTLMYRTTDEAQMRIRAARIRAKRGSADAAKTDGHKSGASALVRSPPGADVADMAAAAAAPSTRAQSVDTEEGETPFPRAGGAITATTRPEAEAETQAASQTARLQRTSLIQ
jgi:hypothetical protein